MTMPKFATEDADRILARLDKLASTIQAQHEQWGIPFEAAKSMVNDLDKTADEIEVVAFGERSLHERQAELVTAKVVQRESDEPYMDTFQNPQSPHQVESDEPYMSAYQSDDSSEVIRGRSESGRRLAPEAG